MKCFKHLCAKLFLCLFVGGISFTIDVDATELTDATGTVEVATAPETMLNPLDMIMAMGIITATPAPAVPDAAAVAELAEARAQDVDYLSRLVQTEGGTFDDRVCVALTALHRVDSPQFPNTVKENIDAPSQYAEPAKGTVLPENLLAAEYAMQLWESGTSYSVLPDGYLYFAGNGKRNRFRNAEGDHYDAPNIAQFIPYINTGAPMGPLFLVFIS